MAEPREKEEETTVEQPPEKTTEQPETVDGFPDAKEITNLLGDNFEMPGITTESEEAAPTAEPEPIEDPETGESYIDPESGVFERPPNEDGEQPTQEKDEKGRIFNAQEHAVDDNGNPKKNKRGYFIFLRKDKRGKVDTETPRKAEYMETALLYFDGGTDAAAAMLGDHWKPTNNDQRKSVSRSIARYLESEDAPSLSPSQEMLVKIATYSAPRAVHVDTFDNARLLFGRIGLGIRGFWRTLTGKRKAKSEKPEPVEIAEEIPNVDTTPNN